MSMFKKSKESPLETSVYIEEEATPKVNWFKQKPVRLYLLIAGILIIVAGVVTTVILLNKKSPVEEPKPVKTSKVEQKPKPVEKPKYYSPLSGIEVSDEALTKRPVTAIMIENSPDARPQSGLKDAGIVYEAIAEGGITRFLALYQDTEPDLIGPVRSLRIYYLDWAAPYDPAFVHVGGSAGALTEVRNGNYRDLDQFFNGNYFWRATDRYAPHNVYTNFDNLNKLEAAKGITSSNFQPFARQDAKPSTTKDATSIDINFSSNLYNTHYAYDEATNSYQRFVAGEASLDREKGQIAPAVVVAMHVDMRIVQEDGTRGDITTTGSGEADIFQNGIVTKATWRKNGRTAPLEFVDEAGNTIKLNRGQTWIAAVPNAWGSVAWQN